MSIDKGGLQYKIVVEDAFSSNFGQFIQQTKAATDGLRELAQAAGLVGAASRTLKTASASAATAAAKGATATRQHAKALTEEEEAERKYVKRLRDANVERIISVKDQQKQFELAAKVATAQQAAARAEQQLSKVVEARTRAQEVATAAQRRGISLTDEERKKIGLLSAEEAKLLALKNQMAAVNLSSGNAAVAGLDAETEALRRQARVAKEIRVAELLKTQGLDARGRPIKVQPPPLPDTVDKAKQEQTLGFFTKLNNYLTKTNENAGKTIATFKRLFGAFAAFTAVRLVVQGFRELVSELIRYNANIEQAILGVASLFTAVGDVRDATGETVTATQKLALAQGEARRQVQLLRRDSLQTAGTFEQLLEAFQTAVAPGLESGLNVDQIRQFAVRISQAAAAIGLAQNQLAEEIRSILQGTIQARTTRIAVALGISNDDIRNAKEAGVLFQFLSEKFAAFDEAGKVALGTFNAIFSNLQEGIQLVLQSGGLDFFNNLKKTLQEIFDLLVSQDPITGLLTPDPRAVAVVKAFADALSSAIDSAKRVVASLTFDDAVAAAQAIAGAIKTAAQLAFGFVGGVVAGLRDIEKIISRIASLFSGADPKALIDNGALIKSAALLGEVLTIIVAINAVVGIVNVAVGALSIILGTISVALTAITGLVGAISALLAVPQAIAVVILGVILAIIVAAVEVGVVLGVVVNECRKWVGEMLGVELKFFSLVKLVKVTLVTAFRLMTNRVKDGFQSIVGTIFKGILQVVKEVTDNALGLVATVLEVLGRVSTEAGLAAAAVRKLQSDSNTSFDLSIQKTISGINAASDQFAKERLDLAAEMAKGVLQVVGDNEQTPTIADFIKTQVTDGFASVKGLFGSIFSGPDIKNDFTVPIAEAAAEADTLVAAFEKMPGLVNTQRKELERSVEFTRRMADEAQNAADEFDAGTRSIGLGGDALRARQLVFKAEADIRREQIDLDRDQGKLTVDRAGALNQVLLNEQRIAKLNEEQKRQVTIAEFNIRTIADLERQRGEAMNKVSIARLKANQAVSQGFLDQVDAAQAQEAAEKSALDAIEQRLAATKLTADAILEAANLSKEERQAVIQSTLARIQTTGQLKVIDEQLNSVASDRIDLENQINEVLNVRLALSAKEAAFSIDQQTREIQISLIRAKAANEAEAQVNNAQKRLTLLAAELATGQAEVALAREQRLREAEDLDKLIAERQQILSNLEARKNEIPSGSPEELRLVEQIAKAQEALTALTAQREATYIRNAEAAQLENAQIELLATQAERARLALEQPITFGLTEGLREFVGDALDLFTNFKQIVVNSLNDLAGIISSSLVDAFDPSSNETFRERFRQFLLGFAKAVIDMLVKIAIAKAILGLGFLSGGGSVDIGLAKGGAVTSPFQKAKGFARGGNLSDGTSGRIGSTIGTTNASANSAIAALRPKSLDSRDRIPIWAAKGEWMMQAKAVGLYGMDVMAAINDMMIDPTVLRSIAGIGRRGRSYRSTTKTGFATGGPIRGGGAPQVALGGSSKQAPVPAVLVSNEGTMQQLIRGGENTLRQFMRDNRNILQAGR